MRIIVGISGASGVIYGWALLKYLHQTGHEVHAVVTDTGWKVLNMSAALAAAILLIIRITCMKPTLCSHSQWFLSG